MYFRNIFKEFRENIGKIEFFILAFLMRFGLSSKFCMSDFQIVTFLKFLRFHKNMIHNHEVPSSILGPATSKSGTYEVEFLIFSFTGKRLKRVNWAG